MSSRAKVVGFSVALELAEEYGQLAVRQRLNKSELFRRMIEAYKDNSKRRNSFARNGRCLEERSGREFSRNKRVNALSSRIVDTGSVRYQRIHPSLALEKIEDASKRSCTGMRPTESDDARRKSNVSWTNANGYKRSTRELCRLPGDFGGRRLRGWQSLSDFAGCKNNGNGLFTGHRQDCAAG